MVEVRELLDMLCKHSLFVESACLYMSMNLVCSFLHSGLVRHSFHQGYRSDCTFPNHAILSDQVLVLQDMLHSHNLSFVLGLHRKLPQLVHMTKHI